MHDEILVRVLNRVAHGGEEEEPMPDVERLSIAVCRDGLAGDVLHREVRSSVGGDAAVEQARDVRMLETREDLALPEKAPDDLSTVRAGADELEGDLLFELAVGAIREEHAAHPTVADLPDQFVRPDAIARRLLLVGRNLPGRST